MFADGNVGDDNHRTIAAKFAVSLFADELSASNNQLCQDIGYRLQYVDSCDDAQIRELIHQEFDSAHRNSRLSDTEADDCWSYLKEHGPIDSVLLEAATSHEYDISAWAMQQQGWTAVRADRVETWGLSDRKLNRIADGLDHIAEQEGLLLIDGEWVLEDDWVLEDLKTDQRYFVQIEDLRQGMSRLFQRRTRLNRDLSLQDQL